MTIRGAPASDDEQERRSRRLLRDEWSTVRTCSPTVVSLLDGRFALAGAGLRALSRVPQRDRDDFELGPTDSPRAVDVVPMHWMQRSRAERRFCCSSRLSHKPLMKPVRRLVAG